MQPDNIKLLKMELIGSMGTLEEGWRGRGEAGRGGEKNVELNKNQ